MPLADHAQRPAKMLKIDRILAVDDEDAKLLRGWLMDPYLPAYEIERRCRSYAAAEGPDEWAMSDSTIERWRQAHGVV